MSLNSSLNQNAQQTGRYRAILGASVDTWQVVQCIDYANIFYQKRFILEKKERVALLLGEEFVVIESEESVDES